MKKDFLSKVMFVFALALLLTAFAPRFMSEQEPEAISIVQLR